MVGDVKAKLSLLFRWILIDFLCLPDSKKTTQLKSIFAHTILIHDAPVVVRTGEQITHCLSSLVCRKEKDVGRGRDSEIGGRERDEDRGLGHLLPVYYVCQDLLLMGAPSAWGLAPLLTPQWLQMKTHCLFCSPCSCSCACFLVQIVVLVSVFNSSLCMDFHWASLIEAPKFCLSLLFFERLLRVQTCTHHISVTIVAESTTSTLINQKLQHDQNIQCIFSL